MRLAYLALALSFISCASLATPSLQPSEEAFRLAASSERIVLTREALPWIDPEIAAQALRLRTAQRGPQRLIVGLRTDSPPTETWATEVESAKQAFRETFARHALGEGDYYFQSIVGLPFMALTADSFLLDQILNDPSVISINTESYGKPLLNDTVPLIHADDMHSLAYTGSGYSIAIIDTGVAKAHPMFTGKIVAEGCFSTPAPSFTPLCAGSLPSGSTATGAGEPCINNCAGLPQHGSHVAGIAAGASVTPASPIPPLKGVAVGADLISVQAVSQQGTNDFSFSEADVASALGYILSIVTTHNVAAVNMSFVLDTSPASFSSSACGNSWPAVNLAAWLLTKSGVAVVAGAGNSGEHSTHANKIGAPACMPDVISVGATQKSQTFAGYSNAAGILDLLAPAGSSSNTHFTTCLDYFGHTYHEATWSAFPSTNCSYFQLYGTSMATAHVSGAIALLRHHYGNVTPTSLRDLLKLTGNDISFEQFGTNYTKPFINLSAAMNPPTAPSIPASLSVEQQYCHGLYDLYWPAVTGSTEYQLESSPNSSYSPSELIYFGTNTSYSVDVSSTRFYRVRACNTVSCSAWKNGNKKADPLNYCL